MGVSRAELQAVKLERQGETEEAAKLRAHAQELRYEDPYTALQDQLDEAVKNEVCVWGVLSGWAFAPVACFVLLAPSVRG